MEDVIFSGKMNMPVANIAVEPADGTGNVFTGRILKNAFPPGLAVLLDAYKTMVNDQVLSMLDPVEEEISGYQLVLQSNGAKLHTLFVEGDQLSFHTEKPVADK